MKRSVKKAVKLRQFNHFKIAHAWEKLENMVSCSKPLLERSCRLLEDQWFTKQDVIKKRKRRIYFFVPKACCGGTKETKIDMSQVVLYTNFNIWRLVWFEPDKFKLFYRWESWLCPSVPQTSAHLLFWKGDSSVIQRGSLRSNLRFLKNSNELEKFCTRYLSNSIGASQLRQER